MQVGTFDMKLRYYFPYSVRAFTVFVFVLLLIPAVRHHRIFFYYPLAAFVLFCPGGIQVDFVNDRYRRYMRVGNYKEGGWVDIPSPQYISVFRAKQKYAAGTKGTTIVMHYDYKFKVNLVSEDKKRFTVYISDYEKPAIEVARGLSKCSGLRIFLVDGDGQPRWIT